MTAIRIRLGDPRDPAATALLEASQALMRSLFPAEANHYLSIDALTGPGIHFFVAEHGDAVRGCAALAEKDGYAEVKSMFVDPDARGLGIGDALMAHLIEVGQRLAVPLIRLETGNALHAAHRLYARHGFERRGPFGAYKDDPTSLFMERRL